MLNNKKIATLKEKNGITLIALVITIIILLILAGITITQLTGNGLFGKAEIAKQRTRYVTAKEIIDLKLMEIQIDCISKGEEYNIVKIAEEMEKAKDITIEKYYNKNTSSINTGLTKNLIDLEAIVVSVNEYSEYKFLIGKTNKIEGVLEKNIKEDTNISEFESIEDFEKEILGTENLEEGKVNVDILTDLEEFTKTIQEQEKLKYIIEHPEIFMDKIMQDQQLATILFKNEDAMNLIINNDEWRNKILESDGDITGENSNIIKALDDSGTINLPTTGLELYNPETKVGNVLYSSYLYNSPVHSPINAFLGGIAGQTDWENAYEGFPAYIGYDFGEENKVWIYKVYTQPGNNTAPTKMYLQSSNDNINWETIYEFTQYTTPCNETTEIINSGNNRKKSRYWRLYITESTDRYVDLLKIQFYGK